MLITPEQLRQYAGLDAPGLAQIFAKHGYAMTVFKTVEFAGIVTDAVSITFEYCVTYPDDAGTGEVEGQAQIELYKGQVKVYHGAYYNNREPA